MPTGRGKRLSVRDSHLVDLIIDPPSPLRTADVRPLAHEGA
eukprot:CAMPEP_0174735112 /NCGR_PEP_ID=MMETSP1094-20130205/64415_1 /TAXON_ID=156173 /ORGANISM="Chrysochromulina brevifilum, Strain UTEX LB 985" /LENGTH=40 /DNA_ID= /DNA_START= /DNA_END= /DNA_ORIENTATION=